VHPIPTDRKAADRSPIRVRECRSSEDKVIKETGVRTAEPSAKQGSAGPGRRVKLAVQVARELENKILTMKWPIGFQIGQEAALASELGVSRWTLREAVRVLEAAGLVASRKGAGGGLYVASNAHDFVCQMVSSYFEFIHISGAEFSAVMTALGDLAIVRAFDRLSQEERDEIEGLLKISAPLPLQQQMERIGSVHKILVRASGNPALSLCMGVLKRMTSDACIYSRLDDAQWFGAFADMMRTISDLGRAVLDGDIQRAHSANAELSAAHRLMLEASVIHLRQPIAEAIPERAYNFFPPARPVKKAEGVERGIREMIFADGTTIGSSLGSEKELAAQFGVGRWVLREALRSLEQLGVIEMGWGGRIGLRVVSPDPATITDACRRQLRREGMRRQHATEVRAVLKDQALPAGAPTPISDLFENILVC